MPIARYFLAKDKDNMAESNTIQEAITAIDKVLNYHENHLYPTHDLALRCAKEHLLVMQRQGFE
jgi:hypothetical protein